MSSKRSMSRFLIAGTNSGSGKTTLTLGILRAFGARGLTVAPFKCGPDYIDPLFHRQAAKRTSVNLDGFLAGAEGVRSSFARHAAGADAAVVEGVMGLFDGNAAAALEGSSAEIAALLELPVILVVNARGMAGSIAPLVRGFAGWHPAVRIAGVIANNVGSARHTELLRGSLAAAGLPPLLGGVPREWVTDNMSALVTVKGGRRLKVQRAYEFAKAAGFELKLCRPRSPQTKGKVESSNRFLSRLMAYQGDFDGWDDIDEIVARIEDASNSEPNETTGLPPSALFMEEKDALLPVGNLRALEEAMGDVVRVARVPATMLVSAHGEPMSVPRRCIGRPARIVCMPGGAMDCYVGGELVATHVAGGPAYDPAHYAEAMAGKRWFGDAAGDIEAAAAANLGLLDSIGGSL